jgi:hypothetical protein
MPDEAPVIAATLPGIVSDIVSIIPGAWRRRRGRWGGRLTRREDVSEY